MTLSPTDTLVCDTTQLAVWQSDADYNYNRELIAPEVNIFEWLNRWFGEILQSIFGSQFAEDYSKTILISVAVLMLLLIGWFIYKKNPAIFIRSRKNALPYSVGEDTIYGVDFALKIASSLSRHDYREAIRLLYLQTLKQLSDEKRIDWQLYKTPTQYIYEVRMPAFQRLTHHFLRVRYGNLMFAIECRLPKKFVWAPSFSHYDKQPFGCAVFDSLLSTSLPKGYSLSRKTFYELEQEDTISRRGILVATNNLSLTDVDVEAILKIAKRGNKIMLVSNSFNRNLEDTLDFNSSYSYFSPALLKKYAAASLEKDTLFWIGDSAAYPRQSFYFYPQLCSSYLMPDSLPAKVLAEKGIPSVPIALSYPWGKGEIILVSTPLLFTNYGVLDGKNATYIFRLLSQMGDLPIVRTEGYMKQTAQIQMSPFRYFLSQRPLRWALYLTMFTIILFMVFTARRRQRVIPIIYQPENKSLEFTELIGTLYFQKKDHADLVHKKYIYFAEELRREIQVNIEEVANDEHSFSRIAQKTGMNTEEISELIRSVRPVIYGGCTISVEQMKYFIDKMNEIIDHI